MVELDLMDIYDAILRDSPYAAYKFSAPAGTYSNIIGGSNVLTTTASLGDVELVSGPSKPLMLAASLCNQPFPFRFHKEYSNKPFSLEAWVNFQTTGPFSILSHTGLTDGLYYTGTDITFTVNYETGDPESVSWPVPSKTKTYHVVGVYSASKISLYIDGELAEELSVEREELLAVQTDTKLYSGSTTAGKNMLLEAPAVYNHGLSGRQILSHYQAGRQTISSLDISGMFGGSTFTFSDAERDIVVQKTFNFSQEGLVDDVTTNEGILSPAFDDLDVSVVGNYYASLPLSDPDDLTAPDIQGVKISAEGYGLYNLYTSVDDGTSWDPIGNGEIPDETIDLPATVILQVRVEFPAGQTEAAVTKLSATAYRSKNIYASNGAERGIILSTGILTSPETWREPIELDRSAMMQQSNIDFGVLQESLEAEIDNVGTIEMWFSVAGTNAVYILDSRTSSVTPGNNSYIRLDASGNVVFSGFSAVYINGAAKTSGTFQIQANRWYHIIGVYTTVHNSKVSLDTDVAIVKSVALLSTYEPQITATQAASIYNAYFGLPSLSASDSNSIVLSETAPAAKVYTKDWSITGAGG